MAVAANLGRVLKTSQGETYHLKNCDRGLNVLSEALRAVILLADAKWDAIANRNLPVLERMAGCRG